MKGLSIYTAIGLALLMSVGVQHVGADRHRASARNLEGIWFGTVEISPGSEWRIVIEIFPKASGERSASFVIIEQNGTGIPVNEIEFEENRLR